MDKLNMTWVRKMNRQLDKLEDAELDELRVGLERIRSLPRVVEQLGGAKRLRVLHLVADNKATMRSLGCK